MNHVMPNLNPDYTYRCRDCGYEYRSRKLLGVPLTPELDLAERMAEEEPNPIRKYVIKTGNKMKKNMEKKAQTLHPCPSCGGHNLEQMMDFRQWNR